MFQMMASGVWTLHFHLTLVARFQTPPLHLPPSFLIPAWTEGWIGLDLEVLGCGTLGF